MPTSWCLPCLLYTSFAHAAVLFVGAAVLGGLAAAAAGIGRVGNDGIEAVRFKLADDLQGIHVQD